ncbi:MAG: DUF2283 domain-containing protein [Calditrichota bacterium]
MKWFEQPLKDFLKDKLQGSSGPSGKVGYASIGISARRYSASDSCEIRLIYDRLGNSLIIWFDDPKKESICEEFDEDTVLMKDKDGRVIGVERMNFNASKSKPLRWAFEEVEG